MNKSRPLEEPRFGRGRHRCVECKHLFSYRKKAKEDKNGDFMGIQYIITCSAPDRIRSPIMAGHKEGVVFRRNPLIPLPCVYWEPVEEQRHLKDFMKEVHKSLNEGME